jgi:hypothetical protein
MLIVEDSNNQRWRITGDHTPAAWIGYQVKLVRGEWLAKARAKQVLVRKVGCRVVHESAKP